MTASNVTARQSVKLVRNSWFVLAMFWVTLLFQDTGLKYIWGLEMVARIANLAALGLMTVYSVYALTFRKFDQKVWYFYLLPGLLVFAGMLVNITRNTILDVSSVSYYGLMLPWAAYLMVPLLLKTGSVNSENLWRLFYYFMVATVVLGLSDYAAVFVGTSKFHLISTPNGDFMAGRFSLLYTLEDGRVYTRFYGWFFEPGTLAMFLLPALAYAILHNRYFGAAIMLVGFYFTESLGGLISLLMLVAVLTFIKFNKGHLVVPAILFSLVVAAVMWVSFGDYVAKTYQDRNASRTVRVDDVSNTITHLPEMLITNPIGFRLTQSLAEREGELNFGTNFAVGNASQFGGVSAFLGYTACLLVALVCSVSSLVRARDRSVLEKIVFSSIIVLLPFIVQRTVVWDSPLFAFLFAPTLVGALQGRRNASNQDFAKNYVGAKG